LEVDITAAQFEQFVQHLGGGNWTPECTDIPTMIALYKFYVAEYCLDACRFEEGIEAVLEKYWWSWALDRQEFCQVLVAAYKVLKSQAKDLLSLSVLDKACDLLVALRGTDELSQALEANPGLGTYLLNHVTPELDSPWPVFWHCG
jgi:hypothetical protein